MEPGEYDRLVKDYEKRILLGLGLTPEMVANVSDSRQAQERDAAECRHRFLELLLTKPWHARRQRTNPAKPAEPQPETPYNRKVEF